ncbi:MAG: hypothetical protein ACKVJK_20325, partial [Methylophagaceae bacterium]
SVVSNLQGAEVTLPGSFYKEADKNKNIKVTLKQSKNNPIININYDDIVNVEYESLEDERFFDNSRLNIMMSELDAEMWMLLYEKYNI